MKTVYTSSVKEAAAYIRKGGLAAFPTETVYGLGADATCESSVEKIFQAKGRPSDNPLIVHLHSMEQIPSVVESISEDAERLIEHFFPGPLSIILPKSENIPDSVSAGLRTVAIRIPAHSVAAAFLAECNVPVAAPSANLSGKPSPTTWQAVQEDLDGRIDAVLTAEGIDHGIESTVVDCSEDVPRLLRAGSIGVERLKEMCPNLQTARPGEINLHRSPGTRYRHYSPSAEVVLIDHPSELREAGDGASAFLGFVSPENPESWSRITIFESPEDYARNLYETFRECDRKGIRRIFCQRTPSDRGIGGALNDRLRRAAQPVQS